LEVFNLCKEQQLALWTWLTALREQNEHLAYLRLFNAANAEIATVYRDGIVFQDLPPPVAIKRLQRMGQPPGALENAADFKTVKKSAAGPRSPSYYERHILLYRDFMGRPFPIGVLTIGIDGLPSKDDEDKVLTFLRDENQLNSTPYAASKQWPAGEVLNESSKLVQINDVLSDLIQFLIDVRKSVDTLQELSVFNHNGMPLLSSNQAGPGFHFDNTLADTRDLTTSMNVQVRCVGGGCVGGEADPGQKTISGGWQKTFEVYVPVLSHGALVGTVEFKVMGYPLFFPEFKVAIRKAQFGIVMGTVGLTLLMILASAYIAIRLQRRVAQPITRIARVAEEFVNGRQREIKETDPIHRQRAEELASANHYTAESERISNAYAHMVKEIQITLEEKDAAYRVLKTTQEKLIASERQALLGIVAAGVAHEVKNALNPVRLRAEVMLEAYDSGEDIGLREGLELIIKNVRRCTELSNRLSAFAKPADIASHHDFDLNEVIHDALAISKDLLDGAKVEVLFEPVPAPTLKGVPKEIEQAIINFLLNSKDAILAARSAGNPAVGRIWIMISVTNGSVKLKVADDGCGMTEETQGRLFEPFFTTKEAGKGTGLGMSISRNILTAHGADIHVESKAGKGTILTISFPGSYHKPGPGSAPQR
jgi:signal transduction histidine kinase